MDNAQKAMIDKFESMPFEEARDAIITGKIYIADPGSSTHTIAMNWLSAKEAALHTAHDSENLKISRETSEIIAASIKPKWFSKPSGILLIGILGSLLAAGLWYFYGPH